jgi:magnesium chelatase subunit H
VPSVAIYHPDAQKLFESFDEYEKWYRRRLRKRLLDPTSTIGLLLMRPQVVSKTTRHYDQLIRAIEAEGLSVIPALSTLMDNREASKFFTNPDAEQCSPRVSQILSLTGFSFVGGPAMNDSGAASDFLEQMNVPYRSAVSLDMQTIEAWRESQVGCCGHRCSQ